MESGNGLLISRIKELSKPLEPVPTALAPELAPLEGIRAVFFDVYGTLIISGSGEVGTVDAMDSEAALGDALAAAGFSGNLEAAGRFGVAQRQEAIRNEHQRLKMEGTLQPEVEIREVWEEVLLNLKAQIGLDGEITAENIERLAVEYECRVNPTWPMPGALEVVTTLRERGRRLGIVSNAQFFTPLLFEAYFDAPVGALGFEPELCAWSFQFREAKPSPWLFDGPLSVLQAAGKGGAIEPREVLYVGNDLLNDVFSASQAGLRTALFAGDQRSLRLREDNAEIKLLKPDAVITELQQLPELLGH